YLQNPLKTNPAGRMPLMNLSSQEATDLARYLCRLTDDNLRTALPAAPKTKPGELVKDVYRAYFGVNAGEEVPAFEKLTTDKQWADLGGKLGALKGCVECHAIEENGKPREPVEWFPTLAQIRQAGAKGCVAENPDAARVPVFNFDRREAAAVAAFLK